jgi:hypothetical protein
VERSYWLTRFVFLRVLGLVYFFAFLSLAHQVLPLIGSRGLLPAEVYLEGLAGAAGSPLAAWLERPTIFWLGCSDGFLEAAAWVGVGLSALVLAGLADGVLLFLLWFLYLSFVHVGQEWYAYGWEIQLLETGFLAIFLCAPLDPRPFPRAPPPLPVILCLRWLIARIMLGAGLIKIRGDECWRDLSCLCYHYETQPLPNPLSRLLHHMPRGFHQAGCLANHLVELVLPWLAFGPKTARRVAGALFILFQLALIASGNLSFLNYLTIAPAVACLDDGVLRRVLPGRLVAAADRAAAEARPNRGLEGAAWALLVLVAVLSLVGPVPNLLSEHQIMNTSFNPLHLVNTYGAFGSVDRERLELVIEGTEDADPGPGARWRAYELPAKPGDPARPLPVTAPYHYRLDWQIWFVPKRYRPGALPPWLVHLVWKLLENDPETLRLFANRPFPDRPPRFVRIDLYRYEFTPPGSAEPWSRRRLGPWLAPVSREDERLRGFLRARGWIEEPVEPPPPATPGDRR